MDTNRITTHLEIAAYHAARITYHQAQLVKALDDVAAVRNGMAAAAPHPDAVTDPHEMRELLERAWDNNQRVICTFAVDDETSTDADFSFLLQGAHELLQDQEPNSRNEASFHTYERGHTDDYMFPIGKSIAVGETEVYISSVRLA